MKTTVLAARPVCARASMFLLAAGLTVGWTYVLSSAPARADGAGHGAAAGRSWPACSSMPARVAGERGVPNFGKLNDAVWRSGQPTRDGYVRLASEGLKTVINLRKEFPQDKDRIPAGVNYVFVPIVNDQPPTAEQTQQVLKVISDPANWPVLVHCQAGVGRTGAICAIVRCSMDRWDDRHIMGEVNSYFDHHWGMFSGHMAGSQQRYIRQFEQTTASAQTANSAAAAAAAPAPAASAVKDDASASAPATPGSNVSGGDQPANTGPGSGATVAGG